MRTLTKRTARDTAATRKPHAGGRPRVPTPCPKCGAICASARLAQVHECPKEKIG